MLAFEVEHDDPNSDDAEAYRMALSSLDQAKSAPTVTGSGEVFPPRDELLRYLKKDGELHEWKTGTLCFYEDVCEFLGMTPKDAKTKLTPSPGLTGEREIAERAFIAGMVEAGNQEGTEMQTAHFQDWAKQALSKSAPSAEVKP
jgi:hypothetical protein